MAEYLKPNQIAVPVVNEVMIDLERSFYEYQGYRSLLTQFASDSPFTPDQEKFDQILIKYIESYVEYNIIFNTIVRALVPTEYQQNNIVASFELSVLLVDK